MWKYGFHMIFHYKSQFIGKLRTRSVVYVSRCLSTFNITSASDSVEFSRSLSCPVGSLFPDAETMDRT